MMKRRRRWLPIVLMFAELSILPLLAWGAGVAKRTIRVDAETDKILPAELPQVRVWLPNTYHDFSIDTDIWGQPGTSTNTTTQTTTTTSGAVATVTVTKTVITTRLGMQVAASDICTTGTGTGVCVMTNSAGKVNTAVLPDTSTLTNTFIPWSVVTGTNSSTAGNASTSSHGFMPILSGSNGDVMRCDGTCGPPGGTVSIADAVTALDAHDVAMFRFAEAYGSTAFVNALATGTNTSTDTLTAASSSTTISHAVGLHEGWAIRHTAATASTKSGPTRWENSQFTVAAWIKLTVAPPNDSWLLVKYANQNSYTSPYYATGLYVTSGGAVTAVIRLVTIGNITTGTSISSLAWPLNEWHYAAITWDTHYLSLYLNGQLVAQSADQGGATVDYTNHGEWRIGGTGTTGGGTGNTMYVQDFNIRDVATSAADLLSRYRRGVSPTGKAFSW